MKSQGQRRLINRPIKVFIGRTCNFVDFVLFRLQFEFPRLSCSKTKMGIGNIKKNHLGIKVNINVAIKREYQNNKRNSNGRYQSVFSLACSLTTTRSKYLDLLYFYLCFPCKYWKTFSFKYDHQSIRSI